MTVVCLIPTWGRPHITEITLRNIWRSAEDFAKLDVSLIPVATVSDQANLELCRKYRVAYYALPNKPIGEKLDSAIRLINEEYDYNYLMTLGSDNILLPEAAQTLTKHMNEGVLVAGYQDMVFIKGDKQKKYRGTTMFGAGRIVNSFVISNTLTRLGMIYGNKDRGLDGASFRNFKRAGTIDFTYLSGYEVIDIKGSESINDFEAFNVRATDVEDRYNKYLWNPA